MKKKSNSDLHAAAVALGSIRSARKAASARRNGLLGGIKPSGLATERELRRRIRSWCLSNGIPWRQVGLYQTQALLLRRCLLKYPSPLDAFSRLLTEDHCAPWVNLLPESPTLL